MKNYLSLVATMALALNPLESISQPPKHTEISGRGELSESEKNIKKGLRQWSEYGNVWAATRKAAKKKFNQK